MARPKKTGLDYLALDCNMSDEVNLIIADYGIEGYGILISMFQSIYGDKGYYTKWSKREQKLFSRKLGVSQEKVVTVISECISWGIFSEEQFNENNILTSRRIQDHYSTSTYQRVGVEMMKQYLIVDLSSKPHIKVTDNGVSNNRNSPSTIVSGVKSTQSTVEYSNKDIPMQNIKEIYDYYLSQDIIQHNKLTVTMSTAIAKVLTDYPIEELKAIIDRHKKVIELTKKEGKFKTQKRGVGILFSQKINKLEGSPYVYEEYLEGGSKYERYIKTNAKKETPKINRNNVIEMRL